MYILGISAFYHDSAAVLIKNGQVICAIEEERLSRIKHDNSFPYLAINSCLEEAGITMKEVDIISYYEKPLLKFERILDNIVKDFPFSLILFTKAIPEWLNNKIKVSEIIKTKLGFKKELFFIPHHLSHASAAFFPSSFKSSAILTIDGVGEYQTTCLWIGQGNQIKLIKSLHFPHSLGLLYSVFTSFLGFKVNEDEYKLMGLSAYGKPTYKRQIYQLISLKSDGSFNINKNFFNFENYLEPWCKNFKKLFGEPRKQNERFDTRYKNIAASIQTVTEEIYFNILNHLYESTKIEQISIGGGVALNALANGKIFSNTPFKKCSIFGAAGDSGGSLGAALYTWHSILKNETRTQINSLQLGTSYHSQIGNILKSLQVTYKKFSDEDKLVTEAAKLLSQGEVIGWFYGKMEYGPRSLGGRSILANPHLKTTRTKVNSIKLREQFRPFAGSVMQEKTSELFNAPSGQPFPFMTFCFKINAKAKGKINAIRHKDNTCRIQTVSSSEGRYYKLLKKFNQLTGIPCLLNTSFNLAGEPIVESPKQAIEDFQRSKINYLFIEDFLLYKT